VSDHPVYGDPPGPKELDCLDGVEGRVSVRRHEADFIPPKFVYRDRKPDVRFRGGKAQDRTPAVHALHGLEEGREGACTHDDEVGEPSAVCGTDAFRDVFVGAEHGVGAEFPRLSGAVIVDVCGDDPACAEGAGKQDVQYAGDAASQDEDAPARLEPGHPLSANDAGEGFDEGALLEGELVGKEKNPRSTFKAGTRMNSANPPG